MTPANLAALRELAAERREPLIDEYRRALIDMLSNPVDADRTRRFAEGGAAMRAAWSDEVKNAAVRGIAVASEAQDQEINRLKAALEASQAEVAKLHGWYDTEAQAAGREQRLRLAAEAEVARLRAEVARLKAEQTEQTQEREEWSATLDRARSLLSPQPPPSPTKETP